jgi:hypothetical protein
MGHVPGGAAGRLPFSPRGLGTTENPIGGLDQDLKE